MGRSIDTSELRVLAVDLDAGVNRREVSTVVRKTAYDIESDGQRMVVLNGTVDTADLLNSIGTDVDPDGMGAGIGPTVDYGDEVEYGTAPHVIRARDGGKLAFPGRGGGMVFVDQVNHPGTAPAPYMGPSFDRNAPRLEQALGRLGEDVL